MTAHHTFETVYRISILDQKEISWLLLLGAAMIFLIIAGIKRLRIPEARRKRGPRWIIRQPPWLEIAIGAFGFVLCSIGLTVAVVRTATILHAYLSHRYSVSEGAIAVLHQQPRSGHDKGDIVRIGDSQFEINHFRYTPGYDRTIAHGGALREGVYVRVFHYRGTILQIDIRKEQDATPG